MKNYIIKNSQVIQEKFSSYLYDKPVNIVNPFMHPINFKSVLANIKAYIPAHLMNNVDGIYVGDFSDFKKDHKNVNAAYKDRAIYVSNDQDNEDDLIDDIIHEIAHSLEDEYQDELYGDERLESEFLAKRQTLYHLIDDYKEKSLMSFLDPEYSFAFDMFLYKKLGYNYLRSVSFQLFYSPYAITSLREYWADGFENYFLGDRQKLKELSPVLYNKINNIVDTTKESPHARKN